MGSQRPGSQAGSGTPEVERFLAALEHPFKSEIVALRQIILGADPSIAEGIKWNAPSFRTTTYFATFHLRAAAGAMVILHLGAKTRATAESGIAVADPAGLLVWLARDRASASFGSIQEIETRGAAFAQLIREWIVYV